MRELTPEEHHVIREGGTEPPFSGAYVDMHDPGTYRCKSCGIALFNAHDKFDSGTGWPSFVRASNGTVGLREDRSHGMVRTEAYCTVCGAHLGHVFDDGPRERGGKRYCINSLSLDFEPTKDETSPS